MDNFASGVAFWKFTAVHIQRSSFNQRFSGSPGLDDADFFFSTCTPKVTTELHWYFFAGWDDAFSCMRITLMQRARTFFSYHGRKCSISKRHILQKSFLHLQAPYSGLWPHVPLFQPQNITLSHSY